MNKSKNDYEIFSLYNKKFPHSFSRINIDFNDHEFMDRLNLLMAEALEKNEPLSDDDVFGLNCNCLI
jgi:hypothetical protein